MTARERRGIAGSEHGNALLATLRALPFAFDRSLSGIRSLREAEGPLSIEAWELRRDYHWSRAERLSDFIDKKYREDFKLEPVLLAISAYHYLCCYCATLELEHIDMIQMQAMLIATIESREDAVYCWKEIMQLFSVADFILAADPLRNVLADREACKLSVARIRRLALGDYSRHETV